MATLINNCLRIVENIPQQNRDSFFKAETNLQLSEKFTHLVVSLESDETEGQTSEQQEYLCHRSECISLLLLTFRRLSQVLRDDSTPAQMRPKRNGEILICIFRFEYIEMR